MSWNMNGTNSFNCIDNGIFYYKELSKNIVIAPKEARLTFSVLFYFTE